MSAGTSGPTSVNHCITRQRGRLYRPALDRIPKHLLVLRMIRRGGPKAVFTGFPDRKPCLMEGKLRRLALPPDGMSGGRRWTKRVPPSCST